MMDTCAFTSAPCSHILEAVQDFIKDGFDNRKKCLKPEILLEPQIKDFGGKQNQSLQEEQSFEGCWGGSGKQTGGAHCLG